MTKQVEIEALKSFNRMPQGQICEPGDVFEVDETRAEELERLQLAKRTGDAPAPKNKQAPAPKTKA